MSQQVEDIMALGSEAIAGVFDNSENELAHHGVKGMKWNKHKAKDDISTSPDMPAGDTPEEFAARQKMIDEYLKTRDKTSGTAKGKSGGGSGGGKGKSSAKKGGGAKKSTKKGAKKSSAKSASSTSSSKTEESTGIDVPTQKKTTYAARTGSGTTTPSVAETMKAVSPRAQEIINEIAANVAAKKAEAEAKAKEEAEKNVQHSTNLEQKESSEMTDALSHLDISTKAREKAAENDEALPDGSYPIRNKGDLARAIQSFGRAKDKVKVKAWIIKRARELDASDLLPESWGVNEIEHTASIGSEFIASLLNVGNSLEHHGVKGMKWGVRKDVQGSGMVGGGGGEIDQDALIAELVAKGLTMDEILKQIQDTFGGAAKTVEDIQKTIQETMEHPFESPQEREWRHNREEFDRRQEQARQEKQKQAEADAQWDKEHGPRIPYDPWGFPTTDDDPLGNPLPRNAKHGDSEGSAMIDDAELEQMDELENFLAHHGVLGMKWGVRKDDRSGGRPQGDAVRKKAPLSSVKKMVSKKSNASEEESKGSESDKASDSGNKASESTTSNDSSSSEKKNSNSGMSDQELRDAIARLQMEKTYKQLMAERAAENNPAPVKKSQSVIGKILSDSGKQALGQILVKTAVTIGTYALAAAVAKQNPTLGNALMKGVAEVKSGDSKKAPSELGEVKEFVSGVSNAVKEGKAAAEKSWSPGEAGKQKIADEMDSKSSSKSSLDIGGSAPESTPEQKKAVEDAYDRAVGSPSSATQQILDELAALRGK